MSALEKAWRRYDAVEARVTAPLSERMLDLAGLQPGMRVLDLATGRGEPALRAARRVGAGGFVLGVDPSSEMLQMTREQADRDGLENLELRAVGAEALDDLPWQAFDAATARWGLMYMASPVAALENARRALAPTGALVAALWAEPERLPYYSLPRQILSRYRPLPPVDLEAPGTCRFGHLDRIVRDFEAAGFRLDHVEEMELAVFEAETAEEVVAWACAVGLGPWLVDLSRDERRAFEEELASGLEGTREGALLRTGGVTRIVRALPCGG